MKSVLGLPKKKKKTRIHETMPDISDKINKNKTKTKP